MFPIISAAKAIHGKIRRKFTQMVAITDLFIMVEL